MNVILEIIKVHIRRLREMASNALNVATKAKTLAEVKPDWYQNNPNEPDYIKNKPFYTNEDGEDVKISDRYIPSTMVRTINGRTGNVWINASDIGAATPSSVTAAQTAADNAQTAADNAQTAADNAHVKLLTVVDEPIIVNTSYNNDNSAFVRGMCYHNGLYVAVGNGGIATSSDMKTWTRRYAIAYSLYDVVYGNGKFVAVGTGPVAYSENGMEWTSVSNGPTKVSNLSFANGRFVAVGACGTSTNRALYSDNGIDWYEVPLPQMCYWSTPLYVNGKFISAGSMNVANTCQVISSENGEEWSVDAALANTDSIAGLAYGNGRFVTGDSDGCIFTSVDGVTWSKSVDASVYFYQIAYGNGMFMAVTRDNWYNYAIYTSDDGLSWTKKTDRQSGNGIYQCLEFINGVFVHPNHTTLHYSTDGTEWVSTAKQLYQNDTNVTNTVKEILGLT